MKGRWPAFWVLIALALVLALPLALRPRQQETSPSAGSEALIIITPNNEQIRHEFARGFNQWRQEQGLAMVEMDWRSSGGTSDLRKQVLSELLQAAREQREDRGIGKDLFWGGGDFEHNQLAKGITVKRDGQDLRISASIPLDIAPETLKEIYPQPDIGGELLYHPKLHWFGAALASFGIVYNKDVLGSLKVEIPQTWADLQDPRLAGWTAMADPAHSGSIAAAYDVILRRQGWEGGWSMLRRVFANARYFTSSAGKVPVDVSAGEAAAGMCIDFYGRYQAGAVGERVGYVDPPFMTAITADPISMLRGAPHPELAKQFVLWVLSPSGQSLWQKRRGTPGGPEKFELRRLPVRKDLYQPEQMAQWTDQVNPFAIARPLPAGMPSFYSAIAPVAHAMAIDVHEELVAAWDVLQRYPQHPRRAQMLALFDALPAELQIPWPDPDLAAQHLQYMNEAGHPRAAEAAAVYAGFLKTLGKRWEDPDQRTRDRLQWTRFFLGNYRQIQRLGNQ